MRRRRTVAAVAPVHEESVKPPEDMRGGGVTGRWGAAGMPLERSKDFKTSTGLEVRFFMPVLNVPFRLIFAYNPQREGVLDNKFQLQKAFQFRFAVGSTF